MRGGPTIKHFADTPFIDVLRYQLADGRVAKVRE